MRIFYPCALADRAKEYTSRKYVLEILNTLYALGLLLVFLGTGLSSALADKLFQINPHKYFTLPLYLFIVGAIYYILDLPFNFYQTYSLEHKYSLSNQRLLDWCKDQLKSGVISYVIILIILAAFYFILKNYPLSWWLVMSLFWVFFSLILAELAPVVIIPLFFKYKELSDVALKKRIMTLADSMRIKILNCFEIDFSKKTLKANAALMGWGKNKRVILADTLKDKYTHDEIEVILAHEFAHYKKHHIFKHIIISVMATLLIFFVIYKTSNFVLLLFRLPGLSGISALPVVSAYFMIFGIIMRPLENYMSRRMEISADITALEVTGMPEHFVTLMDKLAGQNLSDRNPHPLIKFFFFDHPPIDERIAKARERKIWKA